MFALLALPRFATNRNPLRIIGGEDTKPGEIPYQLILLYRNYSFCVATLIEVNGTQAVLTAGHCATTEGPEVYTVVAGDWKKSEVSGSEQTRQVTRIIFHEEFNNDWIPRYDIAILALETPFDLTEDVQPIALPKQGQQTTGNVLLTGWGWQDPDGNYADILQKVEVPVVSDRDCEIAHGSYFIPRIMMCSGLLGVGGKDVCMGDSGGPVKALDGDYLAGIVSWGSLEVTIIFLHLN